MACRLRRARGQAALRGAAAGTLLDADLEVELELRVRQHDRADVPTGHDDAAARRPGRAAAARSAARTSGWRATALTRRSTSGACSSSVTSRPPTRTRRRRAGLVRARAPAAGHERHEAPPGRPGRCRADGEPGEGAVEHAGVEEAIAQASPPRRRRRTTCRWTRGRRGRRAGRSSARPADGSPGAPARRRSGDARRRAPGRRVAACRCARARVARREHRPPRTCAAAAGASPA